MENFVSQARRRWYKKVFFGRGGGGEGCHKKKDFEKSPYCDQGGYHHYLHVGSTPSVGVQGLLSIQLGRLLGGTNKYTTEIHNHRQTWYKYTFKCWVCVYLLVRNCVIVIIIYLSVAVQIVWTQCDGFNTICHCVCECFVFMCLCLYVCQQWVWWFEYYLPVWPQVSFYKGGRQPGWDLAHHSTVHNTTQPGWDLAKHNNTAQHNTTQHAAWLGSFITQHSLAETSHIHHIWQLVSCLHLFSLHTVFW